MGCSFDASPPSRVDPELASVARGGETRLAEADGRREAELVAPASASVVPLLPTRAVDEACVRVVEVELPERTEVALLLRVLAPLADVAGPMRELEVAVREVEVV